MINFSSLDEAYPNDEKLTKKKKKIDSCKPLQPPPYIIPNACETNNTKVIEASFEDGFKKTDYKNDGIKAFDYDEMDAYLAVSDIKKKENFNNNNDTLPSLIDFLKSFKNIEKFSNYNNNNSIKIDINLYNLFLFIFLGIMVILLIDQITRLVALQKK